jgi:hypothetical protein
MSEAGLVRKWDLDTSYILQLEALREGRTNLQDTRDVEAFMLIDCQLSFFVWGVGITISLIVFVSEILWGGKCGKSKSLYISSTDDPKPFSYTFQLKASRKGRYQEGERFQIC